MPRPPRANTAATEVIKARVTPAVVAQIEAARGSLTVSEWIREAVAVSLAEDRIQVQTIAPPSDGHRHRRGRLLSEVGLKGRITRTYACATTGCTHEIKET